MVGMGDDENMTLGNAMQDRKEEKEQEKRGDDDDYE
jgi:hypothetical protein